MGSRRFYRWGEPLTGTTGLAWNPEHHFGTSWQVLSAARRPYCVHPIPPKTTQDADPMPEKNSVISDLTLPISCSEVFREERVKLLEAQGNCFPWTGKPQQTNRRCQCESLNVPIHNLASPCPPKGGVRICTTFSTNYLGFCCWYKILCDHHNNR